MHLIVMQAPEWLIHRQQSLLELPLWLDAHLYLSLYQRVAVSDRELPSVPLVDLKHELCFSVQLYPAVCLKVAVPS